MSFSDLKIKRIETDADTLTVELMDGRVAVIEYKGESYASNDDSREKRLVGERWAQTTGHLFAMVELRRNGMNVGAQLNALVGAGRDA